MSLLKSDPSTLPWPVDPPALAEVLRLPSDKFPVADYFTPSKGDTGEVAKGDLQAMVLMVREAAQARGEGEAKPDVTALPFFINEPPGATAAA